MTETKPKKPRRGWCCGCAVAAVAVVLLSVITLLLVNIHNIHSADEALQAELSRLRAAGEPMTMEDCATPIAPGEKNAADTYAVAFNLTPTGLDFDAVGKRDKQSPAAQQAWENDFVADNQKYLSLVEEASRIPKCAFPKNWSLGPNVAFPENKHFSEAREALRAKAEVERRRGKADVALATCATMLRLAGHREQAASQMGYSGARTLSHTAVKETAAIYSSAGPSSAACRALYEQFLSFAQPGALARALKGQRAYGLTTFEAMMNPNWKGSLGDPLLDKWHAKCQRLRPYLVRDEVGYLDTMRDYLRALDEPYPQALRRMEASQAKAEQFSPIRLQMPLVTPFLLTSGDYALWQDYQSRARAGAAAIACAAKAYKSTHAHYPASLKDLTKTGWRLPSDPFSGKPYHYARENQGLAVWSVGPDLTDNGGVDFAASKLRWNQSGYDFVFRCSL